MAELTYYPSGGGKGAVDQSKLKHHYFAQLTPDGERLVPGMLQQDRRPAIGKWMDVGAVSRTFAERYFVQYTDFNTLVPGSLISADRFPAGKWKEIKPSGPSNFHRIGLSEPFFTARHISAGPSLNEDTYQFIPDIMIPALELVYPETVIDMDHGMLADFYYFKGDFSELVLDTEQMHIFGSPGFYFTTVFSGETEPGLSTNEPQLLFFNFGYLITVGVYSFIMGVYNEDQTLITDYVVLENILEII